MQSSTLLTMALLAIGAIAIPAPYRPTYGTQTNGTSTLTAVQAWEDFPHVAKMQGSIEGVSVDAEGNFYAVDANSFNNISKGKVIFSRPAMNATYLNLAGSRVTKNHGYVVAEAVGYHAAYSMSEGGNATHPMPHTGVFNAANTWLQPNDIAVSGDESTFYFSGMNYMEGTGDLWYVRPTGSLKQSTAMPTKVDLSACKGIGRTNGIELSNDNKHLFLTSATNRKEGEAISVVGASVFRLDIDPATGAPLPETAKEWLTYYKDGADALPSVPGLAKAQMDPDGMRIDTAGYMYSTLNAFGAVLRWNTENPAESQLITLPTVAFPTNLDMGGPDGKTLVVVGRCKEGLAPKEQPACVDKVENVPAAGRAWTEAQADVSIMPVPHRAKTGYGYN